MTVQAGQEFVNLVNTNPAPPFSSWSTAATNIQDAVNMASPGDEIIVSNGVYSVGATVVDGMSNRVAIIKPLFVYSLNGPNETIIQGYQVPGTTNGGSAVRCAYMTNGATLSGFTIRSGGTQTNWSGGGVWCSAKSSMVTNCVLTGNCADNGGGGAYSGTLINCRLLNNSAGVGGAVFDSVVTNCLLAFNFAVSGGGAYAGLLYNCMIVSNSASYNGAGVQLDDVGDSLNALYNCTIADNYVATNSASGGGGGVSIWAENPASLQNCAIYSNSAIYGGGVAISPFSANTILVNCTITGNQAQSGGGIFSEVPSEDPWDISFPEMGNCIVYHNSSTNGDIYGVVLKDFSCSPLAANDVLESGNITNDPQLTDSYHISAASPCRWAGNFNYVSGVDIEGQPWRNPPSIGCDEFYYADGGIGPISSSFTASRNYCAIGDPVNFTAITGGEVNDWVWDYGDGTIVSNMVSETHFWASLGDYTVKLRAYNTSNPGGIVATQIIHVCPQLITNGGFQTGDFTGWTLTGDTNGCSVNNITGSGLPDYLGNFAAALGTTDTNGYLSQTIPTIPSQAYMLSLSLFCDGSTPNEFSVSWEGSTLFDQVNVPSTDPSEYGYVWTNLQFVAASSTANSLLQLRYRFDNDVFGLGNVSLVALPLSIAGVSLSGGDFLFSGINGVMGSTYHLLMGTNLTEPISHWIPVAANVPLTNGNFTITVTNAVASPSPQQFYILKSP